MSSSISTLADLLTRPEFVFGVGFGIASLAIFLFTPRHDPPGWGVALVASVLAGTLASVGQRLGLLAGMLLLSAGGALVGGWTPIPGSRTTRPMGWGLVILGAVLVAYRGGPIDEPWMAWLAPATIVALGHLLGGWRVGPLRGWLGPLMAITAFGMWTTVPDTDLARVLLGASLPLALATLGPISARLSTAGAFPLSGILVTVAVQGGQTRPASVIGALACTGALSLVPMVTPSGRWAPRPSALTLAALHSGLVLVSARVIGLWQDATPAIIAVAALWTTVVLLWRRPNSGSGATQPR